MDAARIIRLLEELENGGTDEYGNAACPYCGKEVKQIMSSNFQLENVLNHNADCELFNVLMELKKETT